MSIPNWQYILVSVLALATWGCNGQMKETNHLHFFCKTDRYDRELQLYVNDHFEGRIPFSDTAFSCVESNPNSKTLDLTLVDGKYTLKVLTFSGNLVAQGQAEILEGDIQLYGIAGGMESRQNGSCLAIEVR